MWRDLVELTKNEWRYHLRSGMFIAITLLLVGLTVVNDHNQYTTAIENHELYKQTEESMIADGFDIEEERQKTPEVVNDGGTQLIENVLAYDYQNVLQSMSAFQLANSLSVTFEWLSFVFFPLIFLLYGLVSVTYDYQHKTMKVKLVRSSFKKVFLSKFCTMFALSAVIMTILIAVSFVSQMIYSWMLGSAIPIDEYAQNLPESNGNNALVLSFSFAVIVVFSMVGVGLGFLFKKALVPALVLVTVHFMVPIVGAYDPRNLLANLGHEVFEFNGSFQLFTPQQVPLLAASGYLFTAVLFFLVGVFFLELKQKRYVP